MPVDPKNLNHVPDDALVYLRTVQVTPFRTLIESLQSILTEVTFIVTRDAMTMSEEDPNTNCLAVATLYGFEHHYIDPSVTEVDLGFELGTLHRKLRFENPDMLVIYVNKEDPNVIWFITHNASKNITTEFFVVRMDLNKKRITMKKQPQMTRYAMMPHSDFQKTIKEHTSLSNEIVIRSEGDALIFATDLELGNGRTQRIRTTFQPIRSNLVWKYVDYRGGPNDFENCYPIRYLDKFCKNALDKTVHVYLREDMALILRYMIGRLGTVHFFLSKLSGKSNSAPRTMDIIPASDTTAQDEKSDEESGGDDSSNNKKRKSQEEEKEGERVLPPPVSMRSRKSSFKKPRVIQRQRPIGSHALDFSLDHTETNEEWASSGDEEEGGSVGVGDEEEEEEGSFASPFSALSASASASEC